MDDHVVTLNAGSSSVKFALFAIGSDWPRLLADGEVEGLGATPLFSARGGGGAAQEAPLKGADHNAAIAAILDWIARAFPDASIAAIGHRVVHGGLRFAAPVIVDDEVLSQLRDLIPLAPLHQPHNLAGLMAARAAFPGVPQIACFDTAFHRGHDFVNEAYALPRAYYDRGLRRFGFHGLSYEYVARRLRAIDPARAEGRAIIAHLGNGASLCALQGGRSIATTMGFTALDGLPMGTRCGQIDPGALLYLLQNDSMSAERLAQMLYHESGLLGLSGLSQDMRVLEASDSPGAREAIDYFVHRIRMGIGALTAALGGVDALVFTAGIGEHSARVRAGVVAGLDWLGFALNREANARHDRIISSATSRSPVYVIPTDEEAMIAYHASRTVGLTGRSAV